MTTTPQTASQGPCKAGPKDLTYSELSNAIGVLANLPAWLILEGLADGLDGSFDAIVDRIAIGGSLTKDVLERLEGANFITYSHDADVYRINRDTIARVAAAINALGRGVIDTPAGR